MMAKKHIFKKIVAIMLLTTIFLSKGGVLPIVSYAAQTSEAVAQETGIHKESSSSSSSSSSTCNSNIKIYTKSNIYKNVIRYGKNQTLVSTS